jgi:hypothetical protein
MEFVYIQYRLILPDGRDLLFKVRLDPNTFEAVESTPANPPAWTALSFQQCPNCPLDTQTQAYCPAALRLIPVMEKCGRLNPYASTQVEVTTAERHVSAQRPLQKGLGSLIGLLIATSGCPRTAFLMPMARFHLPFATDDETLYRASSMYLLAQYYRHKAGSQPDIDLDGLAALYRELQTVNTALTERLKAAAGNDSASHAIVSLDLFSHILPFDIKSSLARMRRLFQPYLAP